MYQSWIVEMYGIPKVFRASTKLFFKMCLFLLLNKHFIPIKVIRRYVLLSEMFLIKCKYMTYENKYVLLNTFTFQYIIHTRLIIHLLYIIISAIFLYSIEWNVIYQKVSCSKSISDLLYKALPLWKSHLMVSSLSIP